MVKLRVQRQTELAQRAAPPRQYFVLDEAVIRRHIGVAKDPAIMPNQLLHIVSRARNDDRITVRVIPFSKGAHAGLPGPFTLLEFDGGLPDLLYLDAGREAINMVSSDDKVSEYADISRDCSRPRCPPKSRLSSSARRPRICPEPAVPAILATQIHLRPLCINDPISYAA